jgi:hypothetical protein
VFNEALVIGEANGVVSSIHLPDYAVVICDDREHLRGGLVEAQLHGNFMSNGAKWKFFRANELDLPTMTEIKNLKGLIIWSSTSNPSFKDTPDGSPHSWLRPVIKLIKTARKTSKTLKILGFALG